MKEIDAYIPHGGGEHRPSGIIVHCMGEYLLDDNGVPKHAVAFLNEYKLSAHVLVAPNSTVFRCRKDNEIAWHARGHNTGTLGIEFLVEGEYNYGSWVERIKKPYLTKTQYESGVSIIRSWYDLWIINSIQRHSDVSPGRKVDPGAGFPWEMLLRDINE